MVLVVSLFFADGKAQSASHEAALFYLLIVGVLFFFSVLSMVVSLPDVMVTSCVPTMLEPLMVVLAPASICKVSPESKLPVAVLLSSWLLIVVVLLDRRPCSLYFRP